MKKCQDIITKQYASSKRTHEEAPEPSELIYCLAEYCVSYICERISVVETYIYVSFGTKTSHFLVFMIVSLPNVIWYVWRLVI
jgi:hypothetical protein